jgi:hypothetical protein
MAVDWKKELANLVATAKTPKEKAAVKAFAKSIGPYLENPELLRTLLGKIQAPVDVTAVIQGKFKNMAEVKKRLPKDVKVINI